MISPEYCRTMARYNAWQNRNIRPLVEAMDPDDYARDRGAFFGSIRGTLNHLLWGDTLWISRFDGGERPVTSIPESVHWPPTAAAWWAERFAVDGRIGRWAERVRAIDLTGDLKWYSGAMGRDMAKPKALCVMQLFNHQTHHRGQVHAMLTQAGCRTAETDIPFMPD